MKLAEKTKSEEAISGGEAPAKKAKKPRRKIKKRWIVLAVIVVLLGILAVNIINGIKTFQSMMDNVYTQEEVENRDISAVLTGSGVLEPVESYTVTTLVSGEILEASFEESDIVSKDDVLYIIDSKDAQTSIERAELSLENVQRNYSNKVSDIGELVVYAPIAGTITGLTVTGGNSVGMQSAIATIEDTSRLKLTEYYSDEYRDVVYIGMTANVSLPGRMLNLTGTVTEISDIGRISPTGVSCFGVTVEVSNIGSLSIGDAATCTLSGAGETIYPTITDEGGLQARERTQVYTGINGKVAAVYVHNNEIVSAGQTILTLSSDTLSDEVLSASNALRDAQLSVQSQYDVLDNYTIKAPIEGTIVEKYFKEGEKTSAGKVLCTIYDLSSLIFIMHVDELDISRIRVGQTAIVTAQAVDGVEYEGVITKVGLNGTTINNVTTYPVTVEIYETEGLRPAMNVDISIVTGEKLGAMSIPSVAVERGNRVLVKTADGSTGEGSPVEGFEYVVVQTGISDNDYIEITDGLKPGDIVAYIPDTYTGNGLMMLMGGGGMYAGGGGY